MRKKGENDERDAHGSELRKRSGIPPRLTEIKIPEEMHQQRVKALNVHRVARSTY